MKYIYVNMCMYKLNHFAVYLKLTQYYKSTILQLKKKERRPEYLGLTDQESKRL